MTSLTFSTRKSIISLILSGKNSSANKFLYFGRLDEVEFLSRLYDLQELPSNDPRYKDFSGDIHQHTINNDDWEYDWVFTDERLKLDDDNKFLDFLCEMFHSEVRDEESSWKSLLEKINELLSDDNFVIYKTSSNYEGNEVYGWRILGNLGINFICSSDEADSYNPPYFLLLKDKWDDFGYKTKYILTYFDSGRNEHKIGSVKIFTTSLEENRTTELPNTFKQLDEDSCSLGQGQDYYESLMGFDLHIRTFLLEKLNDCIYNDNYIDKFSTYKAFKTSLTRFVSDADIELYKSILGGSIINTAFDLRYKTQNGLSIEFNVTPNALPPTNIHAIIGRNSVVKTMLISEIAKSYLKYTSGAISTAPLSGTLELSNSTQIKNLVVVAFSVFDRFEPIDDYQYEYIGLKKTHDPQQIKSIGELREEFRTSLSRCLNSFRKDRWINTIDMLNSDPLFEEFNLSSGNIDEILIKYENLSSGHKIILATITKLVESIDERTLVLIDEPENHLHPPLLSSFIRALSILLIQRNGIAIIATHSPVVLQEIPASCVSILNRAGNEFSVSRPNRETFGENVGVLTHEVFGLEVRNSGFFNLIKAHIAEAITQHHLQAETTSLYNPDSSRDIDAIYSILENIFDGKLGGEARILARLMIVQELRDEKTQ